MFRLLLPSAPAGWPGLFHNLQHRMRRIAYGSQTQRFRRDRLVSAGPKAWRLKNGPSPSWMGFPGLSSRQSMPHRCLDRIGKFLLSINTYIHFNPECQAKNKKFIDFSRYFSNIGEVRAFLWRFQCRRPNFECQRPGPRQSVWRGAGLEPGRKCCGLGLARNRLNPSTPESIVCRAGRGSDTFQAGVGTTIRGPGRSDGVRRGQQQGAASAARLR